MTLRMLLIMSLRMLLTNNLDNQEDTSISDVDFINHDTRQDLSGDQANEGDPPDAEEFIDPIDSMTYLIKQMKEILLKNLLKSS